MKKLLPHCLLMFFFFSIFSCVPEKKEEKAKLAQINDYILTFDEFQVQLAEELKLDQEFKLTKKAKKEFLDQLITKEILIQEAKKRDLDRKEKFIRAIERYWESTLIRDLMIIQGQEIEKRTVVSQEEIKMRYEEMKKIDENQPPLESIRQKISKKIMQDKKSRLLEEWVKQLKKKATIEINEELLSKN
ncbi:MAG: hypothetical protein JSV38_14875 [Desulfobacterales bacterium]|nr:MAG: hypothetical protein JSV38_14875 [Desulfobacterales bacterium]